MTSLLLALLTLFQANFQTGYEPAKCGKNIEKFVETARSSGLDMTGAKIIVIKNTGFSAVGLVNAEYARHEKGPRETNWYHHVILEVDQHIIDFDFGNDPQVLHRDQYFEKMFFEEAPVSRYGQWNVGRNEKLDTYQIEIHGSPEKLTLRKYLGL